MVPRLERDLCLLSEPPPNWWTPVVGSESQEVSDGRTSRRSFTDDYNRRAGGGFEWPLDRIGGQGTWPARFRIAAVVEQIGAGLEPTAAARRPTTQATLSSADHAAEIARLQRENERLRMERDILKKSIAIFAGVPK